MTDMIRREDAIRVMLAYASSYSAEEAETAIRTLPAVTVGVKPLVWRNNGKGRVCADTPFGAYEVEHGRYGMRLLHSGSFMQDDLQGIEAAKAAAQADYTARILAALEPVTVANCVVCSRIVDTREKTEGGDGHGCEYPEGWTCSVDCAEKLHPDPEWMKAALDDLARLGQEWDAAPDPAPAKQVNHSDAVAIREAALWEAAALASEAEIDWYDEISGEWHRYWPEQMRNHIRNAILSLIPKGAAE